MGAKNNVKFLFGRLVMMSMLLAVNFSFKVAFDEKLHYDFLYITILNLSVFDQF